MRRGYGDGSESIPTNVARRRASTEVYGFVILCILLIILVSAFYGHALSPLIVLLLSLSLLLLPFLVSRVRLFFDAVAVSVVVAAHRVGFYLTSFNLRVCWWSLLVACFLFATPSYFVSSYKFSVSCAGSP